MSRPSIEKRVLPGKVRCRKRSKTSTCVMRSSSAVVLAASIGGRKRPDSAASTQPFAFFRDEDLRVVEAGRRAVHAAQLLDGFKGVGRRFGDRAADQGGRQPLQVLIGDSMRARRQRGVADRRGSQRIELRGKMTVPADRLDEIGGADDNPSCRRRRWSSERRAPLRCRRLGRPVLECLARLWINGLGILPVPLVELENVRGIHSRELLQVHNLLIVTRLVWRHRSGEPLFTARFS